MSELGAQLRSARERRGLSLADVEADIRIRQRQLEALEEGIADGLPPGVYARGLVRKYAAYLGLDPGLAVEMFEADRGATRGENAPTILGQPLYRRGPDWSELMLGAGVVILLLIVGAAVWQYSIIPLRQSARSTTPTPVVLASAATAVPLESLALAASPTAAPTAPPPTRTPVLDPTPEGAVAPPATLLPTYGPTYTPEPPTPAPSVPPTEIEVAVEITAPSWLRVTVDGQQVFTATMQPGQSRAWRGTRSINLRTGNAGGTTIFVNGQPLGTLGPPGAVVEREWRLDAGDVVMVTPGPSR